MLSHYATKFKSCYLHDKSIQKKKVHLSPSPYLQLRKKIVAVLICNLSFMVL